MSMNCDIKNLEVLNIVDVEHDSQQSSYCQQSYGHKKLKISWKSLTAGNFLV